ncbi:MAG: 3-keto-5-aminohexanoate cleavage protein [Proteobacteria bacterium]|nr:3-keto-5-aminohexanoate cleavage protein [Pseudomonadota bacterium]
MDPIIILVAPNGARKTKKDHTNIPLTIPEIVKESVACRDAGATLLHLHIRDQNHVHSLDTNTYRKTIDAVRDAVGNTMIIQATSEAVDIYPPEAQMQMVREVRPEAVSLAIREIIPDPSYEKEAGKLLHDMQEWGVFPQYILYSPDEVKQFVDLKKRGIVPEGNSFVLFVLGRKQANALNPSAFAQPDDLDPFLETFDQGLNLSETHWAVCAFGGHELGCMQKTVSCGGHPRIGFENNILMEGGKIAETNAALIDQFVKANTASGKRPIATIAQTKKLLGL